jgi:hypothetical protein
MNSIHKRCAKYIHKFGIQVPANVEKTLDTDEEMKYYLLT